LFLLRLRESNDYRRTGRDVSLVTAARSNPRLQDGEGSRLVSRTTHGFRWVLLGLVAGLILFEASPAGAVPAFSRKYQTSCQTCHAIFPKLNPFGQAFRLNGYHLPAETAEQIRQKPVSLGAEAYERMWPEMVYPSDLPGNVPFALNVKMEDI
jgi:hypothetical protein